MQFHFNYCFAKKNKSCVPRPQSKNCPFRYKGPFNSKYRRFCMLAGCFQQRMELCSERCFLLYKDSRRKMTWHERLWEPSRDAFIYRGSNYSNPALLLSHVRMRTKYGLPWQGMAKGQPATPNAKHAVSELAFASSQKSQ